MDKDKTDIRPLNQVIKETLRELSDVADSRKAAEVVIERMSDAERYEALLRFVPRLVRQVYNERVATPSAQGLPSFDQRVVVKRDEMRLGEVDEAGFDFLAKHRDAVSKGFARRAEEFKSFQVSLIEAGSVDLDHLSPEALGRLAHELRHRLRRFDVLNRNASILEEQLDAIDREGASPKVTFLSSELEAEKQRVNDLRSRKGFLRQLVEWWMDSDKTDSPMTTARPLRKAREFLNG